MISNMLREGLDTSMLLRDFVVQHAVEYEADGELVWTNREIKRLVDRHSYLRSNPSPRRRISHGTRGSSEKAIVFHACSVDKPPPLPTLSDCLSVPVANLHVSIVSIVSNKADEPRPLSNRSFS